MPFKSQAQKKWMYANNPSMAEEWSAHTPKGKKLPKKVSSSKKKTASKSSPKRKRYVSKKAH